jgi:hypothetical protein
MKSLRLLIAACLIACSGADVTELSMQLPQTPFRQLRGVELGMGGKDLHRLRPAATYQPYGGLQETIPGYFITYSMPTATNESRDADVTNLDRLKAVFISEMFDAVGPAEAKWRDKVREITAARGAPDGCETFPTGGTQARWEVGKNTFVIGVFPREPMATTVGPRIVYAISQTESFKQPEGGNAVACPNP